MIEPAILSTTQTHAHEHREYYLKRINLLGIVVDLLHRPCLSREHPLIQTDSDGILWMNSAIKRRFEVAVSAQALLDVSAAAVLGP